MTDVKVIHLTHPEIMKDDEVDEKLEVSLYSEKDCFDKKASVQGS